MTNHETMTYHRFGRTELQLSRVGLGAGGPSRLGTVHGGEADVEALIGCARDLGINHIDTARGYGTEASIGRALQRLDAASMLVATKVFWHQREVGQPDPDTRDPRGLIDDVEASLRDLRRDVIDIFQFHAVLPDDLDDTVHRLLPIALELQAQGKIRHIGITEDPGQDHDQQMARRAAAGGHFDTLMVQYSILDQVADGGAVTGSPRSTFQTAADQDMGVFCMSAARAGFVSTAAMRQTLDRLGDEEAKWIESCMPAGMTPAQMAFCFAAAQPGIDVILVGTGRQDHLTASTAAIMQGGLSAETVEALRRRYGWTNGSMLWQR